MSVGRRGDKTFTGPHGVPTDRLRAIDKMRKTTAGLAERVAPPSTEAVQTYIWALTCPWCGQGPYRILAIHTHRVHGVSAAELREAAGLVKDASICSPEVSATRSAAGANRDMTILRAARSSSPRTFSTAGRAIQGAKARSVSPEQRQRAARATGDAMLAANAAKHGEVVDLWTSTKFNLKQIGERVGMHPRYVKAALIRAGLDPGDGRAARWSR